jgi:hypothetical protein
MIEYEPACVGFVADGPYATPEFVVPEYEYDTVTESDPNKPDCEYESVHDPPKPTDFVPAVTDNADAARVTTDDVTSDNGPVFPAASTTPFAANFNCNVPS